MVRLRSALRWKILTYGLARDVTGGRQRKSFLRSSNSKTIALLAISHIMAAVVRFRSIGLLGKSGERSNCALDEASSELGYGHCADHNAPSGTGASPYAINCRNGIRVSTNDAYLEGARERRNLTIVGNAMVDRVEFRGSRAVALHVRIGSDVCRIEAGEFILSAGAIHSPGILMRSGIGPASLLGGLDIPVCVDAPVGENLCDHPQLSVQLELKTSARAGSLDQRHTNCCVRYSSGLESSSANDMIFIAFNLLGASPEHLRYGYIWASVYQSFSRGQLRITSRHPEAHPEIRFRMLSDSRDSFACATRYAGWLNLPGIQRLAPSQTRYI